MYEDHMPSEADCIKRLREARIEDIVVLWEILESHEPKFTVGVMCSVCDSAVVESRGLCPAVCPQCMVELERRTV